MMNINQRMRILDVFAFISESDFFISKIDIESYKPCYILIGNKLHLYGFLDIKGNEKPLQCVLYDKVNWIHNVSEATPELGNVFYCVSDNNIYQFDTDGYLYRGYMNMLDKNTLGYFPDAIKLKIECVNTCEQFINDYFEPFNLNECFDITGYNPEKVIEQNVRLKPFDMPKIVHIAETHILYVIINGTLNKLTDGVIKCTKQFNDISNYPKCISRSGKLFVNGRVIKSLDFDYKDAKYVFELELN